MSHYIHNLPGRLRVRAASLRHAECQVARLCEWFAQQEGIESYRFNRKAGSVLVRYDADQLSADDILYQMHKAGCLPSQASRATSDRSHPAGHFGTLLGNALFGTLVKKGVETSVASFAKAFI